MIDKIPKVFISYSWEDQDHKSWVRTFADKLIENGIDADVDQYDLELGDRLPQFMENEICNADYVIIVCTPTYKEKADNRQSGVGYEGHIISEELMSNKNERKFIPVIKKGNVKESIPKFLAGKLAIDFTKEELDQENINDLITTLHGVRKKPKIGARPSFLNDNQFEKNLVDEKDVKILGILTDEVTVPKMDGTPGSALYKIPFKLNKSPSSIWNKLFVNNWNSPPRYTSMHRPKIASVRGDRIILNGTTIDEVQKYHRDTLVLCVEETNKQEWQIKKQIELEEKRKQKNINDHYSSIEEISNDIKF